MCKNTKTYFWLVLFKRRQTQQLFLSYFAWPDQLISIISGFVLVSQDWIRVRHRELLHQRYHWNYFCFWFWSRERPMDPRSMCPACLKTSFLIFPSHSSVSFPPCRYVLHSGFLWLCPLVPWSPLTQKRRGQNERLSRADLPAPPEECAQTGVDGDKVNLSASPLCPLIHDGIKQ